MVYRDIPPIAAGGSQVGGGEAIPFPAPTKGLNTRDHFTQLDSAEATVLENWLPDVGSCQVRPGYERFAGAFLLTADSTTYTADSTTLTADTTVAPLAALGAAPVKTLARCVTSSTSGLLCASGGKLYNAASGVMVSLVAGYSNDYWSTDYANGYLFGVNGQDVPWRFDGASLSATGFTGPTLTSLRTVKYISNSSGSRLWFTENNSGDVWYAGSLYVTGALTKFQLSQIADGGHCVGVFDWASQGATVFCMSTGQVLIYQGDAATTFALANKYYAPPLVEPDAAVKMGNELILLTTSGPISMDVVASGLAFKLEALGNWGKIAPSWRDDYKQYGVNLGWFGKFFDGLVYFNIATGSPTSKQYVYNTRNESWTTYTNLPIAAMEFYNGSIYFGSIDGFVDIHAGPSDNGSPIVSLALPGFSYLGSPSKSKLVSAVRPNIFTSGYLNGQFQIDTDFIAQPVTTPNVVLSTPSGSHLWDGPWDQPWGDTKQNKPYWLSRSGYGRAIRPVTRTSSIASDVQWFSTDIIASSGGTL